MKNRIRMVIIIFLLSLFFMKTPLALAKDKIYAVTSITTLADFVKQIGGTKVEVESLVKGTQDAHYIEPRPSFVSKLRQADMVVINGLSFDVWVFPLIEAARNPNIRSGGKGYVDASAGVRPLEVPQGKVSMAHGDLHPLGNPHYLTDPSRAALAVKNILDALIRISPDNAAYFHSNYTNYITALNKKITGWNSIMAQHKGKYVVTYHKSWTYFLNAYSLKELGTVEAKPAIPPSPSHVEQLIKEMKANNVKVILKEPYFPDKFPQLIAKETNSTLLVLPEWVGGAPDTETYIALIDHLISKISSALH